MAKRVIVWAREFLPELEGQVVEGDGNQERDERRGLSLSLPVEPRLLEANPAGGYVRRGWGHPGQPVTAERGVRYCPMLLHVDPTGGPFLHMAVAVHTEADARPRGQLRIATMPTGSAIEAAISAEDADGLDLAAAVARAGAIDVPTQLQAGTTTIMKLRTKLAMLTPGYVAFCLMGIGYDASIVWTAATQSWAER